jgi:hypothetical protein
MGSRHDSTNSSGNGDLLEFRSTPAGVAAQVAAAKLSRRIPPEDYLHFLLQFAGSYEALRDRPGPRGKRFTLD